jgi:hypothetical protein
MRVLGLAMAMMLVSTMALGGDAAPAAEANEGPALDRQQIIDLVAEQTVECRKEKDGSLCSNYLSGDGVVIRIMADDGERRDGVWFIDDQDRLCILWQGSIKPLCFSVHERDDGSYALLKNGKHITTLLGMEAGNALGL